MLSSQTWFGISLLQKQGEMLKQVQHDVFLFLLFFYWLFIIVFFFDLSTPLPGAGILGANFYLLVATLFLHCCFATQQPSRQGGQRGLGPLRAWDVIFCK